MCHNYNSNIQNYKHNTVNRNKGMHEEQHKILKYSGPIQKKNTVFTK